VLALLDDLISDSDARSATVIADVEDTVYKAIDYALHPNRRKIIWSGTPFNAKDPLYKAVESGAWKVNVYPVCEKFPCTREEFRGSWEDRFNYDYVKRQYDKAVKIKKIDTFNQELMLRIMSDEDRLIRDCDIGWYKRSSVVNNRGLFNFYITTDFATSEKNSSDFSVISVWAYNNNGDWLYVDGICKQQLMDANIDDLFRLAQEYMPQSVGIEVSGQQGGFIPWIRDQMIIRNQYFVLASDNNSGSEGIRPNTNKLVRFNVMVPMFKMNKILFPTERRESPEVVEALEELTLAAVGGFKSKHDDFIDTISMLGSLTPWKPTQTGDLTQATDKIWDIDEPHTSISGLNSYIV
jgi:predicted phage terminase large subunit-like protein